MGVTTRSRQPGSRSIYAASAGAAGAAIAGALREAQPVDAAAQASQSTRGRDLNNRRNASLAQPVIDLDGRFYGDWLAVFCGRLKLPIGDGIHGVLIEA